VAADGRPEKEPSGRLRRSELHLQQLPANGYVCLPKALYQGGYHRGSAGVQTAEYFADMDSVEELRAEIRRRCQPPKPTCCGVDMARLQARIDKLSKQIDTGAEKLLAAPANLTEILTRSFNPAAGTRPIEGPIAGP